MHKNAKQFSDQMNCPDCGKVWDMNDPEPPKCAPQWRIGMQVAYTPAYARHAERIATVEKIYKKGMILVDGTRFRISTVDDTLATEIITGRWSRATVRILTDEMRENIRIVEKLRRIHDVSRKLSVMRNAADFPDDLLDRLEQLRCK